MRLIDADASKSMHDLISRQEAINAVGSMLRRKFGIGGDLAEITLAGLPSAQPTVDAVPVIRCKDCKYYFEKEWIVGAGSYTTCWYQIIANAQPNDFCSRAERKDNETD